MKKSIAPEQNTLAARQKRAEVTIYPAVADSVDLPDLLFLRNKGEDVFILLTEAEQQPLLKKNAAVADRVRVLDDMRLKTLFAPVLSGCAGSTVTIKIVGRRSALLKVTLNGMNVIVEAHWSLFIPYFYHIKPIPFVHPEILDIFATAVLSYAALAMDQPKTARNESWKRVIDSYGARPELLLASLDIFNKPNVYHIRPTRIWLNRIFAANDEHRLEIDVSADAPPVNPGFLNELAGFVHRVVKNYAFRYGDYLWTQRYRINFSDRCGQGMIECEGKNIVINIHPLLNKTDWKPAVYLGLGYAIMFAMLQSSGRGDKEKNMHLAMMKTWNRYLSFDESMEQQGVRELYEFPRSTAEQQCRCLSESMIGKEGQERVDDFIMLVNYSFKETFMERLEALNERYGGKTVVYFEQLSNAVRSLNTTLMRNNINHGKLIEALRSDGFDHMQLADFLRTGSLDNRCVVDVSEWLLLRTLLYDLINAPKVFKNDYKMLLKVLTKVNKSLLVYIWTLGLENDARYEIVNAYISKVMNDIFVFDRVKIYEIVSDPVECLEAEAVTGYLLNWAGFSPETRRSIIERILSDLPRNVVAQLKVQTTGDVDGMIRVMGTRASGLIGFCLHQAYRWGSTQDELTNRIRSYFPKLLKQAQLAMLPTETIRGGTMLLLLLAQIVSDERDGFVGNIVISEGERQTVRDLIKQCVDWDQRHFVMMVAGIAAGYMGSIDGWALQQFDKLLARYDGGDRVMLRSVVQFDVERMIERTLLTAKDGEESALLKKVQLLRFRVDPVVSDEANRFLRALAIHCGVEPPEVDPKRRDISELVLALSRCMKSQNMQT
ncbi:MAG TPA: hypothetical protein PLR60_02580 [Syntrophorhabdaceae bacterium]|nr:hypothetical protein [Syntrophorhabdaceae bacterium]